MKEKQKFLNNVYSQKSSNDTKILYKNWANTYDEELAENNYSSPKRCAEALSQFANSKNKFILDVGCGTGMSGESLVAEGFKNIDGTDFSPEMLNIARKKNIYKNLYLDDLNNNSQIKENYYNYITAVGVISPNHAGAETIDLLLSLIKLNGLVVFSLNDHALNEGKFLNKLEKIKNNNNLEILQDDYGDHLKNINLKSKIFVIKKN